MGRSPRPLQNTGRLFLAGYRVAETAGDLFPSSLSVSETSPFPEKKAAQELAPGSGSARTGTAAVGGSTLTVINGSGTGGYDLGAMITVTADPPPPGKKFSGWSGDSQILANPSEETTTATIPSTDVTITATYAGGFVPFQVR
jgi:hypothetical protein